jgi:TolB protein
MNADGTGQTSLTAYGGLPDWSPDGSKIAFVGNDGDSEIYVMNADGSGQTQLTFNTIMDLQPDWAPDGLKIAFTSHRDGHGEIYVMNVDGSDWSDPQGLDTKYL